MMESVIAFLLANKMAILSVTYVVLNEVSSVIPALRNNGIVGSILGIMRSLGAGGSSKN